MFMNERSTDWTLFFRAPTGRNETNNEDYMIQNQYKQYSGAQCHDRGARGSKDDGALLRVGLKDEHVCARLFQLFPVPDNERCRTHRGLVRVAKHDDRGGTYLLQPLPVPDNRRRDCTCLSQLFPEQDNERYRDHHETPCVAENQWHEVCCTH